MPENKPIIIAGPTASGKTKLAVELAHSLGGELINIDSRQFYKDISIGTNKELDPSGKTLEGIPFHLINFLELSEQLTIVDFVELAEAKVTEIQYRSKIPIFVGGSGMYINALINGYDLHETEQGDRELLNNKSISELQSLVPAAWLEILNNSDRNNPRRLIRLIEKSQTTASSTRIGGNVNYQCIYIDAKLEELTDKLATRVEEMWQNGFVSEVERLIANDANPRWPAFLASGYREVIAYLNEQLTIEECKQAILKSHRSYARRQLVWFKKYYLTIPGVVKLAYPADLQSVLVAIATKQ